MNDTVTAVWFVKTAADNIPKVDAVQIWSDWISPFAECAINGCWLAPAIGSVVEAKKMAASDWVGFSANLSFDMRGILAPFTKSNVVREEAPLVILVVQKY